MLTVRRLYLYAMSGITLAVLGSGLAILLEVLFDQLGLGRADLLGGFADADRQRLSLAAALVGVALPFWAVHWYLVGRSLRSGAEGAEAERRAPIRALYLAVVLLVAAFIVALSMRDLIRAGLRTTSGLQEPYWDVTSGTGALAAAVIGLLTWVYHHNVRRADLVAGPLDGAAAWWPRIYLYGAALVGLLVSAVTIGSLLAVAIAPALEPGMGHDPGLSPDDARWYEAIDRGSELVAWGGAWALHWLLIARAMVSPGWRGVSERASRVRVAFLEAVIVIGAAAVIVFLSEALGAGIPLALGANDALGSSGHIVALAQTIAVALGSAVPWAVAWWFHHRRLQREATAEGMARGPVSPATATRLHLHGTSLVGLAFGAIGIGWLVGLTVDVAFGGDRTLGDGWKFEIATYVPVAILGFILWALTWARLRARRAADPAAEAASTTRRVALLLVFGVALVTAIGALALVLYRTFATALGVDLPGNPVSELSTPIGALVTALMVAVYHGLAVRGDAAIAARTTADGEGRPTDTETAAEVSGILILRGPADADRAAVLARLRDALPPGFDLDER